MGDFSDELRNRILLTQPFEQYKRLSEYAIFRTNYINKEEQLTDILIDSELREKYVKAYEKIVDPFLTIDYPNYKQIIKNNKPFICFASQKPLMTKTYGHLKYFLEFGPDSIEFSMTQEPMFGDYNKSFFTLTSFYQNKLWYNAMMGFNSKDEDGTEAEKEINKIITYVGVEYTRLQMTMEQGILASLATIEVIKK